MAGDLHVFPVEDTRANGAGAPRTWGPPIWTTYHDDCLRPGRRRHWGPVLRYRCLILDHDDTAVESTRSIHYPAHLASMEMLRPDLPVVDLDTWFEKNFEPGIMAFLEEDLGLTPEELAVEHRVWREFTSRHTPPFFPGFLEALAVYRQRGGRIAVASHSESHHILAHYRGAANGADVVPDLVFGWDMEPRLRKPNPHAVHEVMRHFGVPPEEILVVDDLKPGVAMARAAGVDAAAAGWGHDIPAIRHWMSRHCVTYLPTVEDFARFILQ